MITGEVLAGCGCYAVEEAAAHGEATLVSATEFTLRLPGGAAVPSPEALAALRSLRRTVAVSVTLDVPVPRPRQLLATENLQRVDSVIAAIRAQRPRERFTAVRLGAAGRDSVEMTRLAHEIAGRAGLGVDPGNGDLVVRVRRTPDRDGWQLLIRTTARPLSARPWRTVDYPGAVNATIAACVLDELAADDADALVDLMCGSGTLLLEQLFRRAPHRIVGIDRNPEALAAARENQRTARRRGRIDWVDGDVFTTDLDGPFDRLVANPPWGGLIGDHAENEAMHPRLLARAAQLAAPGARFCVLTHEIRRFERALATHDAWRAVRTVRFFQKGHHPRLFVLERA